MQSRFNRSPKVRGSAWAARARRAWNAARLWSALTVLPLAVSCALPSGRPSTEVAKPPAGTGTLSAAGFGKLPLSFEENRGQSDEAVRYLARGRGYAVFLTEREAVLVLQPSSVRTAADPDEASDRRDEPAPVPQATLRLSLAQANAGAEPSAELPQPGRSTYFAGNDPENWVTAVGRYGRVRYRNVYPGIDLVYYGNQQQLEYDFVVAPGADPSLIRMAIHGAPDAHVNPAGDLVLGLGDQAVVQHKPVVYQEIDGRRVRVEGDYRLTRNTADGSVDISFALGEHDARSTLIIDPVLVYSTYLSGSGNDAIKGMALDAEGNVYVTGFTASADFPIAGGLPPGGGGQPFPGTQDVFISKLNPQGDFLLYSTYLAGNEDDFSMAIKVDSTGAAYVAGYTSSANFPVVGGLPPDQAGAPDGSASPFVAKLNPAGDALVYSTYVGAGNGRHDVAALAIDGAGNAYITGILSSPFRFPIVGGLPPEQGGSAPNHGSPYVAKLNAEGSALVYSSYLTGVASVTSVDLPSSLAVNDLGELHIGLSARNSVNLPRVGGLPDSLGGAPDSSSAYVAKFNAEGNGLIYATYFGGTGSSDLADAIALDAAGNLFVAGRTTSPDLPIVGGLPPEHGGQFVGGAEVDIYVTKINPAGDALVYSTYLAGDGTDGAFALALDDAGSVYLTGQTTSLDFPQVNGLPADQGGYPPPDDPHFGPNPCAFLSILDPAGDALTFSTYLCENSTAWAVARAPTGEVYIAGEIGSADFAPFPIVGGLPLNQGGLARGGTEAFIAKLAVDRIFIDDFDTPLP